MVSDPSHGGGVEDEADSEDENNLQSAVEISIRVRKTGKNEEVEERGDDCGVEEVVQGDQDVVEVDREMHVERHGCGV